MGPKKTLPRPSKESLTIASQRVRGLPSIKTLLLSRMFKRFQIKISQPERAISLMILLTLSRLSKTCIWSTNRISVVIWHLIKQSMKILEQARASWNQTVINSYLRSFVISLTPHVPVKSNVWCSMQIKVIRTRLTITSSNTRPTSRWNKPLASLEMSRRVVFQMEELPSRLTICTNRSRMASTSDS